MQNYSNFSGTSNQARTEKSKNVVNRIIRYLLFIVLLIVMAGHENSNPRFGKSHIDFYFNETSTLLHLATNSFFIELDNEQSINFDKQLNKLVRDFYKNREYAPAWTFNFTTNNRYDKFEILLDSIEYYGIPAEFIDLTALNSSIREFVLRGNETNLNERVKLELAISRTIFLSLLTLHFGIPETDTSKAFMVFCERLPDNLEHAISTNTIQNLWNKVQPSSSIYSRLISGAPEFITFYSNLKTAPDTLFKNDIFLARALKYSGAMKNCEFDSLNTKSNILREFQKEHKLITTGELSSETREKIIEVLTFRYYQYFINIDRLRKMALSEQDYLFINIPEYCLYVFENHKVIDTFRVIVGTSETPTPVISSNIEQIIANPYWTVPQSILLNEMLPKIRTDSNYMLRNQYYVVNQHSKPVDASKINWSEKNPFGGKYYIKQKTGVGNALGILKFEFPNEHSVYMHDTPGKNLFQKEKRAFSHGCIRIQNPEKLAQRLASKYASKESKSIDIKNLIRQKKNVAIPLEATLPIHIQYITCGTEKDGSFVFYKDIYNTDSAVMVDFLKKLSSI